MKELVKEFEGRVGMGLYGVFSNDFATDRKKVYPGSSMPRGYIDGKEMPFDDLYNKKAMKSHVTKRLQIESPLKISLGSTNTTCTIQILNESSSTVSGKLYIVLIENKISVPQAAWDDKIAHAVPRLSLAPASGEPIDLAANGTFLKDYPFTLNAAWKKESCEIMAFVQKSDQEVVQFKKNKVDEPTDIKNPVNGSEQALPFQIQTYKNRIMVSITVNKSQAVRVALLALNGQRVAELFNGYCQKGINTISWSGLDNNGNTVAKGVYFIHMHSSLGSNTRTIIY